MNRLLLLLLIPQISFSQNPGDLYGLYLGTSNPLNSNVGVAAVNPQTAVVSYLTAFPNTKIYAFGDHAVDPIHHSFFQVTGDSVNMYLLDFDIDDGSMNNILFQVDSVGDGTPGTVTIGGNIQGTFYNCADDEIYFCHYLAPWEPYMHFAKVSRSTGAVTELDSFMLGTQPIDNLVIPAHQVAYFMEYNSISFLYDKLLSVDLENNSVSETGLSTPVPSSSFWVLTYNPFDGSLYGLQEDLDSFSVNNYLADLRYIKVDPETGTVTDLTDDFLGNIIASNLAIDFQANQLSVVIQTENPGYPQVATYDITNGTSVINNLSYTDFGNISYPSLIGIDGYLIPKDCSQATVVNNIPSPCDDPVTILVGIDVTSINLGCHFAEYAGKHLQVFDELGRLISDQPINSSVVPLDISNLAGQVYFYTISAQGKRITSGTIPVMK
jgi:hypothetical protein